MVQVDVPEPRRQEAEFITTYPETRFLTGAALLPNTHRIEPRPDLSSENQMTE